MRSYRLIDDSRFIFWVLGLVFSHELDDIESLAPFLVDREPLGVPFIQVTLSALILVMQVHVHLVLGA